MSCIPDQPGRKAGCPLGGGRDGDSQGPHSPLPRSLSLSDTSGSYCPGRSPCVLIRRPGRQLYSPTFKRRLRGGRHPGSLRVTTTWHHSSSIRACRYVWVPLRSPRQRVTRPTFARVMVTTFIRQFTAFPTRRPDGSRLARPRLRFLGIGCGDAPSTCPDLHLPRSHAQAGCMLVGDRCLSADR
jgi:hypothetical protein